MSCFNTPSVYHAAVIIFLEFFAFGLLTAPMISVLNEAFPKHTFLMNGLIQGVKGFLSFFSAPLIGSLSDIFGRKPFLLLTVTFTCSPIPLIKLSHWWYFTMISISGIFAVTFSVVLAFVSDVTTVENRSWAYGLVSATFAASLIISPSLGAFLEKAYSENFVIALASLTALADIAFIIFFVPESLESSGVKRTSPIQPSAPNPPSSSIPIAQGVVERRWPITWDKVDPFGALRHISQDRLTLLVCLTTFLSYLPEAGEYSCFFVYLRLVMGFSEENVALFIAICGLISCIAQTCGLGLLMSLLGPKRAIIIGLAFEACQLAMFGFFNSALILWSAGCVAGLGSITYPALSAFYSNHVTADQQGLAQGLLTGIRGLCGGLGPALYGFIFYVFQVNLNLRPPAQAVAGAGSPMLPENLSGNSSETSLPAFVPRSILPGPPFAFGAILALLAIMVAIFIPDEFNVATLLPLRSLSWDRPAPRRRRQPRLSEGRGSQSSSCTNLLAEGDDGEAGIGADRVDKDVGGQQNAELYNVEFLGLDSRSTDRRRRPHDRLDDLSSNNNITNTVSRHHRQPSASKIPRTTAPHAFFPARVTALPHFANPLRRILASSGSYNRQRSHSPPLHTTFGGLHQSVSGGTSGGLGDLQQHRDAEAADLANFRVPTCLPFDYLVPASATESVSAGGGEISLPMRPRMAIASNPSPGLSTSTYFSESLYPLMSPSPTQLPHPSPTPTS